MKEPIDDAVTDNCNCLKGDPPCPGTTPLRSDAESAHFVAEVTPQPDDPTCSVCGRRMVPSGYECLSCQAVRASRLRPQAMKEPKEVMPNDRRIDERTPTQTNSAVAGAASAQTRTQLRILPPLTAEQFLTLHFDRNEYEIGPEDDPRAHFYSFKGGRSAGESEIAEAYAAHATAALRAERRQLRQRMNDLHAGMYVNCVYCGYRYGPDKDTPVAMANVLKQHIEVCPQHPLSHMKQRAEQAEQELAQFKRAQEKIRHGG